MASVSDSSEAVSVTAVAPVFTIPAGRWFRKPQGTQLFQRISESSAKKVGLDVREHVYGVGDGNIIVLKRSAMVVPVIRV